MNNQYECQEWEDCIFIVFDSIAYNNDDIVLLFIYDLTDVGIQIDGDVFHLLENLPKIYLTDEIIVDEPVKIAAFAGNYWEDFIFEKCDFKIILIRKTEAAKNSIGQIVNELNKDFTEYNQIDKIVGLIDTSSIIKCWDIDFDKLLNTDNRILRFNE